MKRLQQAFALLLLAAVLLVSIPAYAFAAETKASRYPVIFIPGIGGTELYNREELVWVNTWRLLGSQLPVLNLFNLNWLLPLRLKADGSTPYYSGNQIRTGGILRTGQTNVYGDMLDSLAEQGYKENKDLFLFPYDWRRDPTETVGQLQSKVDAVLKQTGAQKVVLLSHSLGGLIARDYVVRGGAAKVKATVSMATPFLGSPMAYRALEYGWDMGLKLPGTKWSALAPKDVKLLTQNYPSVYALAPGKAYWGAYPGGYLTRSGKALTYTETVQKGIRPHNPTLSDKAASYSDRLLDGSNHGVMQFVLAGKGKQTVVGFTETKDWLGITHKSERFTDGDEVVPLKSADPGAAIGHIQETAYANEAHTFFTRSPEVQRIVNTWLIHIESVR